MAAVDALGVLLFLSTFLYCSEGATLLHCLVHVVQEVPMLPRPRVDTWTILAQDTLHSPSHNDCLTVDVPHKGVNKTLS